MDQSGQPRSRPSISGTTRHDRVRAESTTPPKSSRGRRRPRVSRSSGIAARKAHDRDRQVDQEDQAPADPVEIGADTSAPPSNCPTIEERPSVMP